MRFCVLASDFDPAFPDAPFEVDAASALSAASLWARREWEANDRPEWLLCTVWPEENPSDVQRILVEVELMPRFVAKRRR